VTGLQAICKGIVIKDQAQVTGLHGLMTSSQSLMWLQTPLPLA
jgi:hypothetical protein